MGGSFIRGKKIEYQRNSVEGKGEESESVSRKVKMGNGLDGFKRGVLLSHICFIGVEEGLTVHYHRVRL